MVTAMLIAHRLGANKSKVLYYANSGDITGDHSGVVGYMAAAFWANPTGAKEHGSQREKATVDLGLASEEKLLLLQFARDVIEAHCHGGKAMEPEVTSSSLTEPRGAFVTLHQKGKLRGCIGYIHAQQPLIKTVAEMAMAAAFNDPRFPPVSADDLSLMDLEISVLTPLRQISTAEEIQVGKHGIYIKRGGCSGLLLPQVATHWGWDRTTFLEHTCTKAGLAEDAWKDDESEIYVFSADIFSVENL